MMPPILMPAVALALALSVLNSGAANAELVAGGWLMLPPIPKAAPPPPRQVACADRASSAPPGSAATAGQPRPGVSATPPSDGKVRF